MRSLVPKLMSVLLACLPGTTLAQNLPGQEAKPSHSDIVVRIVTISEEGLQFGTNDLLEPTLNRLNQAAAYHPDIACLPEIFSNRAPETVPGPVTERLSEWAREHSSYVIFGIKVKEHDRLYNSAILLDRKGTIAGRYNEIHPTDQYLKEGVTPGQDAVPPVFQTDFGTIGIQICQDINWTEEWHRLKQEGAQIVFWPSGFPATIQLSALASMNHYYVVCSPKRGSAGVYDITGEALAASGNYQHWAEAAIPMGKRIFEVVYATPKIREIQQKYGPRVEVKWYHDSDWVTLRSLDPNVSTDDLIKLYGMTTLDDEIAKSTRLINQARAEAEAKLQPVK